MDWGKGEMRGVVGKGGFVGVTAVSIIIM